MRYGLDQLPDYGITRAGTAALQTLGFSREIGVSPAVLRAVRAGRALNV